MRIDPALPLNHVAITYRPGRKRKTYDKSFLIVVAEGNKEEMVYVQTNMI